MDMRCLYAVIDVVCVTLMPVRIRDAKLRCVAYMCTPKISLTFLFTMLLVILWGLQGQVHMCYNTLLHTPTLYTVACGSFLLRGMVVL